MTPFWSTVLTSGFVAMISVRLTRWFDRRERERRERSEFERATASTLAAFDGDPEMQAKIEAMAVGLRAKRGWKVNR